MAVMILVTAMIFLGIDAVMNALSMVCFVPFMMVVLLYEAIGEELRLQQNVSRNKFDYRCRISSFSNQFRVQEQNFGIFKSIP